MTAAREIGRQVDAAAEAMIREHKAWFEQAFTQLEQRLAAVEERERKLAEAERWVSEKRDRIERAIAANA
jgi:hypothetical protein